MKPESLISKLKSNAVAFYDAIKMTDFSSTGLNLANFPRECCHHACTLLGAFLFDQGFEDIRKIVGGRPSPDSDSYGQNQHLWLEVSNVTVDITAYQFEEIIEKVIVSTNSNFHTGLNGESKRIGMEGEPLQEYFIRIKDFYNDRHNGLYDHLAELALFFLPDNPDS